MNHDKDSFSILCSGCDTAINVSPDEAFNDLGWENNPVYIKWSGASHGVLSHYTILCPHCINEKDEQYKG